MHLLVRESRTIDEDQGAVDLGHAPADLVFLSFSDSDLGAAAAGWQAIGAARPTLRLASLARLRHPMSVDLYAEQVIAHTRCIVARVLGGLDYWRYGAEQFAFVCNERGIKLALLPGDERMDGRLAALSTLPTEALTTLEAYFRHGGPENFGQALVLAAALGGLDGNPPRPPAPLPRAGEHALAVPTQGPAGLAAIVFYRSHLLAGDVAPVTALAEALCARRLGVQAMHVASLKESEAASFVAARLRAWRPSVVLNATGFSAGTAPLDAANAPVLQVVLSGSERAAWAASARGLSQTDLAMQVVLPELDGRLLTTAISFKAEAEPVPGLDFSRIVHRPDADGIAMTADRAAGWARLAATPRGQRRVAIVLSNYPGGGQAGYAIGLDSFASLDAIARLLGEAGYAVRDVAGLCRAEPTPMLSLSEYRRLFAKLPETVRAQIVAAWGEPESDFSLSQTLSRHCLVARSGRFLPPLAPGEGPSGGLLFAAIQPDRGHLLDRKSGYHDPDLPPCHHYVAFHLWLRHVIDVHAIIHLGAHGTLEWLPGKAAVLSAACFPAALLGGVPVIYPFIVNNPGEAAAAKRRLGAVTIGHLTPPLVPAESHGAAEALERLIEDYAAADGLDRRRATLLRREILDRACATGLLAESGIPPGADEDATLARLDTYLCDLKELRIRDRLHVFGADPPATWGGPEIAGRLAGCGLAERAALLAALDGAFVAPGPAGAPSRGRADVLPTGRNLFAVDPRAVPTRAAVTLAERAADELLRRHRQDHGDWPRALMIDLWGSATMRTGGEDFALALLLLGVRPIWDEGSSRVSGVEILPLAALDRPRVDVTLRISGLFRDAFEAQVALFDQAVRAVAARAEDGAFNSLAAAARGRSGDALRRATARVFGAAPGCYGAGVSALVERGAWADRAELGASYIAASAHAYGRDLDGAADLAAFSARVAASDGLVHTQDHAEIDLLDSTEFAAHEGGFAAAAESIDAAPALYHLDTSHPDAPRARTLAEELARVVRGRAANPAWIAGMMRHGYRGAAEISRALDALHAFAATLPGRLDRQFDLMFDATLGDAATDAFLRRANPEARAAMAGRFRDARERGLWRGRRNDVADVIAS